MPDIVGIRFKKAGKVYYFDPAGTELKANDYVVVQTARGLEMGQVMIAPRQVLAAEIITELKPILRKASEEDIKHSQDFAGKESGALDECSRIITKNNLPMKLVSAEYNLDGTRLTFFFTAEERVDFRELVRELTSFFKSRIELRQIGPRDHAKIVGGLGRCGRPLCCVSYLTEFTPVSIKMAKEQDLPLDPMKISGVCGRLQCCLAYESSQYREAKALMPRKGQLVETSSGKGIVTGVFPIKDSVLVEFETHASAEFPLSQIKLIDNIRPQNNSPEGAALDQTEIEDSIVNGTEEAQAPINGMAPETAAPIIRRFTPNGGFAPEAKPSPESNKLNPLPELSPDGPRKTPDKPSKPSE